MLELSGADNRKPSPALDCLKREAEERLRAQYREFTRQDFLQLPVLAAYDRYYRRFKKTYHVLLQVESIVSKGRALPSVSPLVDANFLSEVQTFVLTAAHDVAKLRPPIFLDASTDQDSITQMKGVARGIYGGDMVMRDAEAVCCSIIYGQDDRSPLSADTTAALYVAYAPEGVPARGVEAHLRAIEANVRLCSPAVKVEQCQVHTA